MACCCCNARPCDNPCPPCLPCSPYCTYRCPAPPACPRPSCPPPPPCSPCAFCRCSPPVCVCKPPVNDDYVGHLIPVLPPSRCMKPPGPPVKCRKPEPVEMYSPVLPCCPPPEPPPPPPPMPICEPTVCVSPVIPCCTARCPPPCIPKQRPICPRAPRQHLPCIPMERTCCVPCPPDPCTRPDPITRRRPLIVFDSVREVRYTGLPGNCYELNNPDIRYAINEYWKPSNNCHNVCVPLC